MIIQKGRFPSPSDARLHLSKLILKKHDDIIGSLLPRVPGLRLGLTTTAKPEPHYLHLVQEELKGVVSSQAWQSRMEALYLNGKALALWAAKRDGVPIILTNDGKAPVFSHADFDDSPKFYDPAKAIEFWKRTIPLSDVEAESLLASLSNERIINAATGLGADYTKALMDSITELFQRAKEQGLSLSDFRKEFSAMLPDRAKSIIESIYRTHLAKEYGQERLGTIRDAGLKAPFIQYMTIPDDRRTVICMAMSNYIAASGDNVWDEWVPPNHYQCRSDLSPIPYLEAIRRGLAQRTPDRKGLVLVRGPRPFGPPPQYAIDPKTKRIVLVVPQEGFRRGEKLGLAA